MHSYLLLFLCCELITVYCDDGISLSFAIDNTGSMWNEIEQVKTESIQMTKSLTTSKSSQIKHFVLVTFNDPDVKMVSETTNTRIFLNDIAHISHTEYNRDCPEMALTGIILALEASRIGSTVYVFTDASAKDYLNLSTVTDLCHAKLLKVVFLLTGYCSDRNTPQFKVYYKIADACSGKVIETTKRNITDIIHSIITDANKDRTTPLTSVTLPPSIFLKPVKYNVDQRTEYVIITTLGNNVELHVSTSNRHPDDSAMINARYSLNNVNAKVLRINNPSIGTYYAWVRADSSTSVEVVARTDFTFEHGFSSNYINSIEKLSKQPLAGKPQYLGIQLSGIDNSISIQSIQILSQDEKIKYVLPFYQTSSQFLVTDPHVFPLDLFKIAIIVKVRGSNEEIRRVSATAISSYFEAPKIINLEDSYVKNSGDRVFEISCDAVGYPEPKITWKKDKHIIIKNSKFDVRGKYLIINNLVTIDGGSFICEASNDLGKVEKSFKLFVAEPPKISNSVDRYVGKSGDLYLQMYCDATGSPDPIITWKRDNNTLRSDYKFDIRGKYLTIKNLAIKDIGEYTCEAANNLGVDKKSFELFVSEAPVIVNAQSIYYGKTGDRILEIPCEATGSPNPVITWKRNSQDIVQGSNYNLIGRNLIINNISTKDASYYTCIAVNDVGATEKNFQLFVSEAPHITNTVNRYVGMSGDRVLTMHCDATGSPEPKIKWRKENRVIFNDYKFDIRGKYLTIKNLAIKDIGEYTCEAANNLGVDKKSFELFVSEAPVIVNAQSIYYGKTGDRILEIPCEATGSPNPVITWKRNSQDIVQGSNYNLIGRNLIINNISTKDAGYYTCIAVNDVGATEKNFQLFVSEAPHITNTVNRYVGMSGDRVLTMHCDATGSPEPKIKWRKENRVIFNDSKFDDHGKYLIVKNLVTKDAGKFTCTASSNIGKAEKTFDLFVTESPKILNTVDRYVGKSGDKDLKMFCNVTGTPDPNITWKRDDVTIKNDEKFDIQGKYLIIKNLTTTDISEFICEAASYLGVARKSFGLFVSEAPKIVNTENIYAVVEGDDILIIPCNATGSPPPTITWKTNNTIIVQDSKYGVRGNQLVVRTPAANNTVHNFACEAINTFGSDEKNFTIEVTDSVYDESEDTPVIYGREGKQLTINCSIAEPHSHVRWYLNDQATNQSGSQYIIGNASVIHDGNYTCRVNTDHGSKSENHVVNIGFRPYFQDAQSVVDVNWQGDENSFLSCPVYAKPGGKYKWIYNGKAIVNPGSEFRELLPIISWGKYICQVSNVHGYSNRNYTVSTEGCLVKKPTKVNSMPLMSDPVELMWPKIESNTNVFIFKTNDQIKLSCIAKNSSLNDFKSLAGRKEITASCVKEDDFDVEGKRYKFAEFECTKPVESSVIDTKKQCLSSGFEIIRIGFEFNDFLELYRVCYDKKNNVPAYTMTHVITTSNPVMNGSNFEWIQTAGVGDGKASGGYNCTGSSKCCYDKGQLTNPIDVISGPAQAATFRDHLNSVAVWKPCESNRTSWNAFEEQLRYNRELFVYDSWTGASDYVAKNGGFVPRYLWKVISFEDILLAMVYVNDPNPTPLDVRCSQTCDSMVDSSDDYLYCCSIDEFSRQFDIPLSTFTPLE